MTKIKLFSTSSKKPGQITVPDSIFNAKINKSLMAQTVKVYLSNQRRSTAKTKSRGDVKVTHAKVWRQKGTGRARHGSRNAPIFVGGAKAHGPSGQQNYSRKLTKKMKRLSLFSALSSKTKSDQIIAIADLDKLKPKTKIFHKTFNELFKNPKKLLLITSPSDTIQRPTKNLSYINLTSPLKLNTYQTLNARHLIFTPEAIKALKKHYQKTI